MGRNRSVCRRPLRHDAMTDKSAARWAAANLLALVTLVAVVVAFPTSPRQASATAGSPSRWTYAERHAPITTRTSIRDTFVISSEVFQSRGWAETQNRLSESVPANVIGDAYANNRHPLGEMAGRAKQGFALVTVAASLVGSSTFAAAYFSPGEELRVPAMARPPPPPSFFQTVAPGTATLSLAAALPSSPRPSAAAPYTGPLVDTTEAVVVALDAGVTYRDFREGDGAIAVAGRRVNVQWALKRSNGYSIDSSAQNDGVPFIFVVGGGRAIPGLDAGVRGMAVGGIRRLVIPPGQAYRGNLDDPDAPGPIPPGFGPKQRIRRVMENRMDVPDESFLLDIKLTRVQ